MSLQLRFETQTSSFFFYNFQTNTIEIGRLLFNEIRRYIVFFRSTEMTNVSFSFFYALLYLTGLRARLKTLPCIPFKILSRFIDIF